MIIITIALIMGALQCGFMLGRVFERFDHHRKEAR